MSPPMRAPSPASSQNSSIRIRSARGPVDCKRTIQARRSVPAGASGRAGSRVSLDATQACSTAFTPRASAPAPKRAATMRRPIDRAASEVMTVAGRPAGGRSSRAKAWKEPSDQTVTRRPSPRTGTPSTIRGQRTTHGPAPGLGGTPTTAPPSPASGKSMKSLVHMTPSLTARGAAGPGTGKTAVGVGPPPVRVEGRVVEVPLHGNVEGRPARLVVGQRVPEALLEDPFVAVPANADVADVELGPLVGRADRLRLRDGERIGQCRVRVRGVAGRHEDEVALAAEALGLDVLREDHSL